MNFWSLVFGICMACAVAPGLQAATRTGGPYRLHTEQLGSGGGRATGAVYTMDSSLGGIGGISLASDTQSKAGYIGQLYEAVTLEVTAASATVEERSTLQLEATVRLDDETRLAGLAGDTVWTVLSGPVTGITNGGLLSAGKVHEDLPASVQGTWSGLSGSLNLTVLDVFDDRSPLTLSSKVYQAHQGATRVEVTVVRTSGEGPVSVTLATGDGTDTAVPPFIGGLAALDYQALNTVIQFADQEVVKTQTIELIPRTGKVPNTRFNVTLDAPGIGAVLGAVTTAEIQVLAPDTTKPTLALKTPAAGIVSSTSPVPITGVVGDTFGIDRLEYTLNDSAPVTLMLGQAGKATAIPFASEIEPEEGPNRLSLTAYDLRGNSTTLVRDFVFERRYLLTLLRDVPAAMQAAPDKAGMLTLSTVPSKAASSLTQGPAPQSSQVVHGAQVSVTASAKANHLFSHWTGLPDGAQTQGNGVVFTMPEEDVPNLTAVFVANPFPELVGAGKAIYQGLIRPDETTDANNGTVGMVTGALTPTKGSLSGKIWLDGKSTAFVAHLHGNGSLWFLVEKVLTSEFAFLGRSLEMSWSEDGLDMRVSGPAGTSEGSAKLPAYSKSQPVDPGLLNTGGKQGYYTVALPAKAQASELDTSAYPQGYGYKTFTLLADGSFKLAGLLADGTQITSASYLVERDVADVFIPLPTPGTSTMGGSFSGTLVFDPSQANSDVSAVDLQWFRPEAEGSRHPLPQLYTAGWPGGVVLDAVGALYDKRLDMQTTLGLSAADADGNAQLIFQDGQLATPPGELAVTNFNIALGKVVKIPASDKSFSLKPNQAKGLFGGTFTPNWSQPNKSLPKFQGVLLQKGANKGGYGYFVSNRIDDPAPQSGGVTLKAAVEDP